MWSNCWWVFSELCCARSPSRKTMVTRLRITNVKDFSLIFSLLLLYCREMCTTSLDTGLQVSFIHWKDVLAADYNLILRSLIIQNGVYLKKIKKCNCFFFSVLIYFVTLFIDLGYLKIFVFCPVLVACQQLKGIDGLFWGFFDKERG